MACTFKLLFLSLLLLGLSPYCLQAQNSESITSQKNHSRSWKLVESGFSLGFGYGVNSSNLPEGNYSPLFFIRKFAFNFPGRTPLHHTRFQVTALLEPQFNLVFIRDRINPDQIEYELGIGLGIQNRFLIDPHFSIFYNLIIGPQYFSTQTIRQSKGLIFSDNLGIGLSYKFAHQWGISEEFRIRHMSNANIAEPNYGINTNNFLFSLSRFFP